MKENLQAACDLLVISPHTDDLEIGLGGTAALLSRQGKKVWGLDLTRGELGSNATVEERWREAAKASRILGLTGRVQLEMPDGFIDAGNRDQVEQLVAWLRILRPRWVVTCPDPVRHPDHQETPRLVAKACFMARLASLKTRPGAYHWWEGGAEPGPVASRWQVGVIGNVCPDREQPSLIFDVGSSWDAKRDALTAYASQFQLQEGRRATAINDPAFMDRVVRRANVWGSKAGVEYGEAVQTLATPVYCDLPEQRWV